MKEYISPNQYFFFGTVEELRKLVNERTKNLEA